MAIAFPLAPMTWDLRGLTWVLMVLPLWLLGTAATSPPAEGLVFAAAGACALLIYAGVWFVWRPTRFDVDDDALRLVWPVRSRTIARRTIGKLRIVTQGEFRREYGLGMRIGAGGLWGGFGLLKTRATTFSMWISRTDRLVIVELSDARPLLVTPDDPERFVEALRR